ncbi:hypothetical protein Ddye_000199 [Dipteronia dyeriana]|uniref:Uncharacterized protein n=1 Tax=Dipteronia dyeriana TaxID=168575 RepID=A0AAD9XLW1_9ROSI|nr:hypothetical protein Ddye_000199 [Dipteronia dyeriana]
MFPSNNNNGSNNDQVCFSDQCILHWPHLNDIITTNSNQDHQGPLSSNFFQFSSPFLHYESALEDDRDVFLKQHHDLLLNHHHQQPLRADHDHHDTDLSEIFVNMADSSQNDINVSIKDHNVGVQQIPIRKRASKRDRHTKIKTAKGLRDRRMRLSLDVARNFFDLQDMLGYDKASKTVQWLLIQAQQKIKKLEKGLPQMNYSCCVSVGAKTASSTSKCTSEVVASGIVVEPVAIRESNISKAAKPSNKERKIRQSPTHKISTRRPLARDLRVMARARARERTIEKMRTRKDNDLNQLAGSWCSFETGEESGIHSRDMNQSLQPPLVPEHYLGNQETMVDDSHLVNIGKCWSPYPQLLGSYGSLVSSFFNCLHNINETPQEHQLTDFQFFSKT